MKADGRSAAAFPTGSSDTDDARDILRCFTVTRPPDELLSSTLVLEESGTDFELRMDGADFELRMDGTDGWSGSTWCVCTKIKNQIGGRRVAAPRAVSSVSPPVVHPPVGRCSNEFSAKNSLIYSSCR